jgi:hypothetical protein
MNYGNISGTRRTLPASIPKGIDLTRPSALVKGDSKQNPYFLISRSEPMDTEQIKKGLNEEVERLTALCDAVTSHEEFNEATAQTTQFLRVFSRMSKNVEELERHQKNAGRFIRQEVALHKLPVSPKKHRRMGTGW